jgi:hypothetical protein
MSHEAVAVTGCVKGVPRLAPKVHRTYRDLITIGPNEVIAVFCLGSLDRDRQAVKAIARRVIPRLRLTVSDQRCGSPIREPSSCVQPEWVFEPTFGFHRTHGRSEYGLTWRN